MIRIILPVVTIAVAAFVTARPVAVDDPSDPAGLAPIETLTPPPRFKYKNTETERPQEVGAAASDDIDAESDKEARAEMEAEQNLMMHVYLSYFDDLRKKKADQYARDNMDVIKLLMAHGWLYLMKPKKEDLNGLIAVDKSRTLEDLRNDLVVEIKDRDKITSVADALLWYANGIQQEMRSDAEKDVKTYNEMIVSREIIEKITDPDMKKRLVKENKGNNALLEKSKIYREFNQVTFKMCLMSYILIFRDQPFSADRFTITSSDGRQKKDFVTPPLARDKFDQIMFEAELELEGEGSPFPETETESSALKEYREEQSLIISKYLNKFEQIRVESGSFEEKNAYKIIKLLLVQSWIYMLKPDTTFLKNIIHIEPDKSTDDVKTDVILELKKTMAQNVIEDAINDYANSLSQKVKDTLEKQAQVLAEKLDDNIEQIEKLNAGLLRERKIVEKNDNLIKLEETRLNLQFHELTMKMCLQSYVLNFLAPPYPDKVTINPTHDSSKVFDLPPLGEDSFEHMSYDLLVDSSEEEDEPTNE